MKPRQENQGPAHSLAGSLQPDDGKDPRYDSPVAAPSSRKMDRKGAQLCAQIRRSLEYIVPEVLVDTKFDAMVLDVQPAPNTSHLLIILQSTETLDEKGCRTLESEVAQRSGSIRTAVAQSIHRRKTPSLSFRVVSA